MRNELRLLILESAIAGGWWHAPNPKREEIFPNHLGHREEWDQLVKHWHGLFVAEIAEWQSRLLEREIASGSSVLIRHESEPAETLASQIDTLRRESRWTI